MTQSPTTSASILTIGHSTLELADFLDVVVQHAVKAVCDVRSRPGSFRFPQFNREPLEAGLAPVSIRYELLGDTLGGRPSDPRVYHEDGRVDYTARRRALDFSAGLDRAIALSRNQIVALMCAAADPFQCHRFLMICPALMGRGITPLHIRRGGRIESQCDPANPLLLPPGFTSATTPPLFF